jgi:hypothetical protein
MIVGRDLFVGRAAEAEEVKTSEAATASGRTRLSICAFFPREGRRATRECIIPAEHYDISGSDALPAAGAGSLFKPNGGAP